MKVKVKLRNIVNIKNLVSSVSNLPCDVEVTFGDFCIDAKSMLGLCSLPIDEIGELNVHSDNAEICTNLLERLEKLDLLIKEGPMIKKTEYDVCALGEMLIDFTMQGRNAANQRLFAQNAGGAPANVLAAMSKLGARTAFIGKSGNDMHGHFLKDTLDECGIDSAGFVLSDEYFTTLAFVDVKADGEREFSFARKHGADKMLEKSDVPLDIIRRSGIFHIGSVSLTENPARNTTIYAVEKAKAKGVTISFDPNYRASLWDSYENAQKQICNMIKYTDIIKISEEETELASGESDYKKAADILIEQGVKIVVVTLGKDGAYVRTKDGGKVVKGFKNKAVDATGAGDAFWGGFLYQISRFNGKIDDINIDKAAEFADFANAVASVCVESCGAIPSMPTPEQVTAKMKEERQV